MFTHLMHDFRDAVHIKLIMLPKLDIFRECNRNQLLEQNSFGCCVLNIITLILLNKIGIS